MGKLVTAAVVLQAINYLKSLSSYEWTVGVRTDRGLVGVRYCAVGHLTDRRDTPFYLEPFMSPLASLGEVSYPLGIVLHYMMEKVLGVGLAIVNNGPEKISYYTSAHLVAQEKAVKLYPQATSQERTIAALEDLYQILLQREAGQAVIQLVEEAQVVEEQELVPA